MNSLTKWPEAWIQTAIDLAREEWIAHFKPNMANEITRQSSQLSYFSDMDLDQTDADAFEIYVSSPPIISVNCPIMYWQALQQAGDPLAPMALQFLTCPAASTDVERAFSRGRLTVSRTRHSLSDATTRSATVLSSWLENPDFIPEEQLIKIFDSKQTRPKNGRVNEESRESDGSEGDQT